MAARRPDFPPSAAETSRIGRIGAEGDGIAAGADGAALFVPYTLPGETLRLRRVARRGEGWAARAEALLEPSPDRIAPACLHFGTCGGCALQHWAEAPYRAWKAELLAAALRRAGFAPAPIPLVATEPGTRRRMTFAARRDGAALRLGLHVARGRAIVDLGFCAVLHPALLRLLAPLRALLGGLACLRRAAEVSLNLLETGPDLLLRTDAMLTAADRALLADLARARGIPRIAWALLGGAAPEIAAQLGAASLRFAGVKVSPPPGAFLQATEAGEAAIVDAVSAALPERLPARAAAVELYAGCGTLTFPLARRLRVVAFEGDPAASAALTEAANAAGLAGRVTAHCRDLARRPLGRAELDGFAAVVLDPPRAGAAAQIAEIAASNIARVIYVSCNPATLARDAAQLREAGFRLLRATAIDQFRWSARLESVAAFAR